jgi:tetratricopeptide (TPR) repeat protein
LLLQNLEDALNDFKKVLEQDPQNLYAHYNEGLIKLLKNQAKEAYHSFTQAAKINPKQAETWNNRALALQLLKKWQKATLDIQKARKYNNSCERIEHNFKQISTNP